MPPRKTTAIGGAGDRINMNLNNMLYQTMNSKRHGKGLPLLLGCFLFVVALPMYSQNLVQNPSFEETDSCMAGLSFYPGPTHWFSASGTPDHLLRCVPYGATNGVPLNHMTFQEPQEGDAYVGLITHYVPQHMEYAMSQLMEPLIVGQAYDVSFYTNAGFGGNANYEVWWLATNKIGVLFTMEPRLWLQGDELVTPGNFAHVYHPEIISDTVVWTFVSGTFVADSAYQYMMLGNHFDNANTDTLHLGTPGSTQLWYPRSYTLVDNVSVSRNTIGISEGVLANFTIYPNPATDELGMQGVPEGSTGSIHDAMGRMIWKGGMATGTLTLDVRSWARGAYVMRVHTNGRQGMFKFMLIDR